MLHYHLLFIHIFHSVAFQLIFSNENIILSVCMPSLSCSGPCTLLHKLNSNSMVGMWTCEVGSTLMSLGIQVVLCIVSLSMGTCFTESLHCQHILWQLPISLTWWKASEVMYGNISEKNMQIMLGNSLYILYSTNKGFKVFESQAVRDVTIQMVS